MNQFPLLQRVPARQPQTIVPASAFAAALVNPGGPGWLAGPQAVPRACLAALAAALLRAPAPCAPRCRVLAAVPRPWLGRFRLQFLPAWPPHPVAGWAALGPPEAPRNWCWVERDAPRGQRAAPCGLPSAWTAPDHRRRPAPPRHTRGHWPLANWRPTPLHPVARQRQQHRALLRPAQPARRALGAQAQAGPRWAAAALAKFVALSEVHRPAQSPGPRCRYLRHPYLVPSSACGRATPPVHRRETARRYPDPAVPRWPPQQGRHTAQTTGGANPANAR